MSLQSQLHQVISTMSPTTCRTFQFYVGYKMETMLATLEGFCKEQMTWFQVNTSPVTNVPLQQCGTPHIPCCHTVCICNTHPCNVFYVYASKSSFFQSHKEKNLFFKLHKFQKFTFLDLPVVKLNGNKPEVEGEYFHMYWTRICQLLSYEELQIHQ